MELRSTGFCEMRFKGRTLVLMLVSFSWGAILYAALFSSAREDVNDFRWLAERWGAEEGNAGFITKSDHKDLTSRIVKDVYRELLQENGDEDGEDGELGEAASDTVGEARKEGGESSEREGEGKIFREGGGARHLAEVIRRVGKQQVWGKKTVAVVTEKPTERAEGLKFSINDPFHFPMPHFSLPDQQLLHSTWVSKLQEFLSGVTGHQVSLVTASIEHQDVLLNWLISAHLVSVPPLENVLVLTLDESLYQTISSRGISTLYVSETMVISPEANITKRFSQVHVVRLSVIRLMIHYGFTVVNYDCDAIVLRNPQPIFDGHVDADVIGTFGKGPSSLYQRWGITLNTGVMLMRSNAKLEQYWELMSEDQHHITDDQANINFIFAKLNVRWINLDKSRDIDKLDSEVYGVCKNHMIVMLLPENKVCRYVCDPLEKDQYYVWHTYAIKENRTVENKMSQAKIGSAWFLREDWSEQSAMASSLRGVEWLRAIADRTLIR